MKFHSYTFALSDFAAIGIVIVVVILALCCFGDWICDLFDPCERDHLDEAEEDALIEEHRLQSASLEETGIAAEIAHLPPGSQLVEIDTAGMLTPPGAVMVHEYRWTGSTIEFVRTCPLHAFDFTVPAGSTEAPLGIREWPELKQAREQFEATASRLSDAERARVHAACAEACRRIPA